MHDDDDLNFLRGIDPQGIYRWTQGAKLFGYQHSQLAELAWAEPEAVARVADKRAEARMKGYTGEACSECNNFTLVRNGTCLKCDTCGATTGCS